MVLVSSSELSGAPLLFAVRKALRSPQNGYRFTQVAQSESFTVSQMLLGFRRHWQDDGNALIGDGNSIIDGVEMQDFQVFIHSVLS